MRALAARSALAAVAVVVLAAAPGPRLPAASPATPAATGSLAAAAPAPDGGALLETLAACRARLDRELDVGYARIAARCPDLARELAADRAASWLPQGWQDAGNDLSAGGLEELRTLIARERDLRAQSRAPRVQRLHEVVAELGEAAQSRSGLWARLTAWLRQVLSPEDDPGEPGFLSRLLGRIGFSERVIEFIAYAALAAFIGLAGLVVWQEIRASGLPRRGLAGLRPAAALRPAPQGRARLAQLERASLAERPSLLLGLVLDELSRRQRLPPPRALTTRELVGAAELAEPQDTQRLRSLAVTAEDVRFAARPVEEPRLRAALADGVALIERIAELGAREGAA